MDEKSFKISLDDRFVLGLAQLENKLKELEINFEEIKSFIPVRKYRYPLPFSTHIDYTPKDGVFPIFLQATGKKGESLTPEVISSLYDFYLKELSARGRSLSHYLDGIELVIQLKDKSLLSSISDFKPFPRERPADGFVYLTGKEWEKVALQWKKEGHVISRGKEHNKYLSEDLLIP